MTDIHNLCDTNSLVGIYMSQLRDKQLQNDRMRFRRNVQRLGQICAYEISKNLNYAPTVTETPLGDANTIALGDKVVLATILRAGLPFHEGFLSYFDDAENAFVSAYREYTGENDEFRVNVEYLASPSIESKTLVIVDPMLATGTSLGLAYRAMLQRGTPARIHVASVIATDTAIHNLGKYLPEDITTVWSCDIDKHLNEHSYIVPGLGDAGDLLYGEKL